MAQELISKKTVAIIGGGAAGCICGYFLQQNFEVSIFDNGKILHTLLPTGGGRCNLAHNEYDFKVLASNYPRGEKFLYSIFSRFGTSETIDFFNRIGVKTYSQDDNRIFPTSNSSRDVREKFLNAIKKVKVISEKISNIEKLENCYKLTTSKSIYAFDIVVVAIGGHSNFDLIQNLGIKVEPPTQALVGLVTKENFSTISGVSLNNISWNNLSGDILFTHKGISGPLIYKISSINAKADMPYKLNLNLANIDNFQEILNKNSHKEIKNVLAQYFPKSFVNWFLKNLLIKPDIPSHKINGQTRDKIVNHLKNFEINIIGKVPDGEVVTCGGINLKEINSKTLESKRYKDLYFCGEILDIDGFCGGFNLQNCWSTGYVVAQSIIDKNTQNNFNC
jgi:hypothetical protein